MKRPIAKRPIVPKAAPQAKKVPDDTIYITPEGYRIRLAEPDKPEDPILGRRIIEVSNGKWWYIRPGTVLRPE